jgi:membrane protein YdbS with pleckstrin-like domain
MSSRTNEMRSSVLLSIRPWILLGVLARAILFVVLTIIVVWIEFYFGLASVSFVHVQVVYWTVLVFFLAWVVSLWHLLALKYSHKYVLRNDSLEVRSGIVNLNRFVITSSGFSDLVVHQSLWERIFDVGEIVIFSESEQNYQQKMVRVRHPMKVAEQIRFVMGRPIVRSGSEGEHKPAGSAY